MLKEFTELRQERDIRRRLFADEGLDVYVWYAPDEDAPMGFQIVYFDGDTQKAFTWSRESGFTHDNVEGWDDSRFNRTPFLVSDGAVPIRTLDEEFAARRGGVDPAAADFIAAKLAEYEGRGA